MTAVTARVRFPRRATPVAPVAVGAPLQALWRLVVAGRCPLIRRCRRRTHQLPKRCLPTMLAGMLVTVMVMVATVVMVMVVMVAVAVLTM